MILNIVSEFSNPKGNSRHVTRLYISCHCFFEGRVAVLPPRQF